MPNRLAAATSPYLRQHQDNPVDWYEWGDEAFARARAEDRPILLSVGYSACHWCHVMAHESFEDPAIAAQMNAAFVNIKVDREERPDIDTIYQKVVQLLGQGGGWPLTVFLTPSGEPFYGGTYFPPHSKYGRPGFTQVLDALAELYASNPAKIAEQVASFREGFTAIAGIVDDERRTSSGSPELGTEASLREAGKRLVERVDPKWGGFGREPKFPNPTALEILAVLARGAADDRLATDAGNALRLTLDKMAEGGIYDHLRGGFARYSTDQKWLVPHFEKMLYDNAMLLPLYAEAAVGWPEAEHLARVVRESVAYLVAEMRHDSGTFFAATDADSEGVEGKYFVWTPEEIAAVLGDGAPWVCALWGVTRGGNFEGASILHLPRPLEVCAREQGTDVEALLARLEPSRAKLLAHRATRVPPALDDKRLASWNALLVSGLVRSGFALGARDMGELGVEACAALWRDHVGEDGRVARSAHGGRVHLRGVLDDVAFLGRACLDVHEWTLDPTWLDRAAMLAAHAVAHYGREAGFFLTADDAEALIERTESQHDGPLPSGVGVMVELLARLDACDRAPEGTRARLDAILERFRAASAQPFGYASLLTGAMHAGPAARHVKLRGPDASDASIVAIRDRLAAARLERGLALSWSFSVAPKLGVVACQQMTCRAVAADPDAVLAAIG
jgi:uncharacterized protein